MILIFLKHFDTTKQSLFGIGKTYMPGTSKVRDLIPVINEKMGWASGTSLKLYEVANDILLPTCYADVSAFPRKLRLAGLSL